MEAKSFSKTALPDASGVSTCGALSRGGPDFFLEDESGEAFLDKADTELEESLPDPGDLELLLEHPHKRIPDNARQSMADNMDLCIMPCILLIYIQPKG